jgi:hypothetical protein
MANVYGPPFGKKGEPWFPFLLLKCRNLRCFRVCVWLLLLPWRGALVPGFCCAIAGGVVMLWSG